MKHIALFVGLFVALLGIAQPQNATYDPIKPGVKKEEALLLPEDKRMLLVPFESKMYMSEISKNIADQSKMSFKEMVYAFQSGLDAQLMLEMRKKFQIVSLMKDTAKYNPEIQTIHANTGYQYDKVPPRNAEGKRISANQPQEKEKGKQTTIQNGQLSVPVNTDKRFMNAKLNNPELLTKLSKVHQAGYFLFVNELDIKRDVTVGVDPNGGGAKRTISVHYTIFDKTGKKVDADLVTTSLPADVNDPKKIIDNYFSVIAKQIYTNFLFVTSSTPIK